MHNTQPNTSHLNLSSLIFNTKCTTNHALTHHITTSLNSLSSILKSSYGPRSFDKIILTATGDQALTNDGATILKSLNLTEPITKLLVSLSLQQERECGDGTTSVVLLAISLIKIGLSLKQRMHTSIIINGFKVAYKECANFISSKMKRRIAKSMKLSLASTVLNSKIANGEFFANLLSAVDLAKLKVMKKVGQSMVDSHLLNGYVVNCRPVGAKNIKNAKAVLLSCNLEKVKMPLIVNVNLSIAEVEKVRKAEEDLAIKNVDKLRGSGVNVILSTGGVDDFSLGFMHDMMVVKRVSEDDLKRLSELFAVPIHANLSDNLTCFNIDVETKTYGNDEVILINNKNYHTLMLRGSSHALLDELERNIEDITSLCKKEVQQVLPGGGAVECALYLHLKEFLQGIATKEYVAVDEFANCLIELVKILVVNAGLNGDMLVTKVLNKQAVNGCFEYGLDLCSDEVVVNCYEKGVVEPAAVKVKMLRLATEAAVSILRIDEIMEVEEKEKKK